MKIYKEGEKSKAICELCGLVPTTFFRRNVSLSNKKGMAENILVSVCDKCGTVVAVPQQSAPRIREAIAEKKRSIEVRLPRHLLDILAVATDKLKAENTAELSSFLVKIYIHKLCKNPRELKGLAKYLKSDLAIGAKASDRLSLKVSAKIFEKFRKLRDAANFESDADLIKAIILRINDDIVNEKASHDRLDQLKEMAMAV